MDLSGLDASRLYYEQLVGPVVMSRWSDLPHAAARLGGGSDVLGLDDGMSRDHDWGLRLTLLVDGEHVAPVDRFLADALPETFLGLPTRFATSHDPMVKHRVEVQTPRCFAVERLGVDVAAEVSVLDWLSMTGQALGEITSGQVFADTAGELTQLRGALSWYPRDVWLHVVAADWCRLAEELPLVGRSGYRDDDAGSRIIAARQCATLMHLGFMLERRWPPYPKWLGSLFATLASAGPATGQLQEVMTAETWQHRQNALARAARTLYEVQRATDAPCVAGDPIEPFHDRPFLSVRPAVLDALRTAITDPAVRAIPPQLGSIEQCVDNVAVLTSTDLRRAASRALYAARDPS